MKHSLKRHSAKCNSAKYSTFLNKFLQPNFPYFTRANFSTP